MATRNFLLAGVCIISVCALTAAAQAQRSAQPWLDPRLDPDQRATLVQQQMTRAEMIQLVDAKFPIEIVENGIVYNPSIPQSAGGEGFVYGVPRLGIPDLQINDGGLGVADLNSGAGPVRGAAGYAVPLPSQMATTASWDPLVALAGGTMIGGESRRQGHNIMLAGAMNLVRDPRDGRTFEYSGEDPLLAGTMTGAIIAGVQSNHVISTMKHFALNDQETGRMVVNSVLRNASARESDLLAFEFAQSIGNPGAVMCSYNRYNAVYACSNDYLLNKTLKTDWKYKGFVLSDYGATHSALDINDGLDQESADFTDAGNGGPFFNTKLEQALQDGTVLPQTFANAVHRILRSMFANGLFDHPLPPPNNPLPLDVAADAAVSKAAAEQGAVLLKNNGLLPLSPGYRGSIAIFGSNANRGVMSGGGSSQVYPVGGPADPQPTQITGFFLPGVVWNPSPPAAAIQALAPNASVSFDPGTDLTAAAATAKAAGIAIVIVNQYEQENSDLASLSLGRDVETGVDQDALVKAVAAANPRTIVVLETGGPVLMPWLPAVPSVLEAWYPGFSGGEVIADLLFGRANPSGHLPITFPASEQQLPRPTSPAANPTPTVAFDTDYNIEGASVGYKWFIQNNYKPLFPFGFGLSYTTFRYGRPVPYVFNQQAIVTENITNTGDRAGYGVAQIYASLPNSVKAPVRLIGFGKVFLKPGETRTVVAAVDPKLLSTFNERTGRFDQPGGTFTAYTGPSAQQLEKSATFFLPARSVAP